MPKRSKASKRPRDTVANAVFVMKQATGELPKEQRPKARKAVRKQKKAG